jgi:hypothetical protein
MEELQEIKQMLKIGNYEKAYQLIEDLEEMGKQSNIRNICRFLVILIAHLIKHKAENRMRNSWLSTIVNCVVEIQDINLKDNKKSLSINK